MKQRKQTRGWQWTKMRKGKRKTERKAMQNEYARWKLQKTGVASSSS